MKSLVTLLLTADELTAVRVHSDRRLVSVNLDEWATSLSFSSPAEFCAWADRLFELAHADPEIAAAWTTYPAGAA